MIEVVRVPGAKSSCLVAIARPGTVTVNGEQRAAAQAFFDSLRPLADALGVSCVVIPDENIGRLQLWVPAE